MEATTAACDGMAAAAQSAAEKPAKRSVFLCNIMRLIIIVKAGSVIL